MLDKEVVYSESTNLKLKYPLYPYKTQSTDSSKVNPPLVNIEESLSSNYSFSHIPDKDEFLIRSKLTPHVDNVLPVNISVNVLNSCKNEVSKWRSALRNDESNRRFNVMMQDLENIIPLEAFQAVLNSDFYVEVTTKAKTFFSKYGDKPSEYFITRSMFTNLRHSIYFGLIINNISRSRAVSNMTIYEYLKGTYTLTKSFIVLVKSIKQHGNVVHVRLNKTIVSDSSNLSQNIPTSSSKPIQNLRSEGSSIDSNGKNDSDKEYQSNNKDILSCTKKKWTLEEVQEIQNLFMFTDQKSVISQALIHEVTYSNEVLKHRKLKQIYDKIKHMHKLSVVIFNDNKQSIWMKTIFTKEKTKTIKQLFSSLILSRSIVSKENVMAIINNNLEAKNTLSKYMDDQLVAKSLLLDQNISCNSFKINDESSDNNDDEKDNEKDDADSDDVDGFDNDDEDDDDNDNGTDDNKKNDDDIINHDENGKDDIDNDNNDDDNDGNDKCHNEDDDNNDNDDDDDNNNDYEEKDDDYDVEKKIILQDISDNDNDSDDDVNDNKPKWRIITIMMIIYRMMAKEFLRKINYDNCDNSDDDRDNDDDNDDDHMEVHSNTAGIMFHNSKTEVDVDGLEEVVIVNANRRLDNNRESEIVYDEAISVNATRQLKIFRRQNERNRARPDEINCRQNGRNRARRNEINRR
ncbi:probable ATP-dependent helicase PF08_0048 [Hydra vulgaris]|uniref:Probable ATP-dependent helicase PF08_0048 n=1 Tax=Hydra vulgaris TaxID=6087 RepID=A0ABM4DF65_HYDVU